MNQKQPLRRFFVVGILLIVAVYSTTFAQPDQPITFTVDFGEDLGEISPYVYGANFGPLSVISVDLFDYAENSGVNFLRFPGGRWGDLNDIQPFQIDMYMKVIDLMGAEPSIHVRLEGGTPEAAAELVRYCNIEKDYNVKYWYIGNEPSLFDDYTVEDLNEQWRAIALAMLEVDPDIVLIGPEPHQWNGTTVMPRDPNGKEWVREFLKVNGDLVDVVAVHRYPFPLSQADPVISVDQLRQNVTEWGFTLEHLRALGEEVTGRTDLLYAVTEANSHWSNNQRGEATPDSHMNAIWWADVLGRLIQDQPFIVGYFELQTLDRRGVWGLIGNDDPRPTYYTYQLYKQFGTQLYGSASDADYASVFAASREDGTQTLIVTNLYDDPQTAQFDVQNGALGELVEVHLFDPERNAELVDVAEVWDAESEILSLPARSVALLVFE